MRKKLMCVAFSIFIVGFGSKTGLSLIKTEMPAFCSAFNLPLKPCIDLQMCLQEAMQNNLELQSIIAKNKGVCATKKESIARLLPSIKGEAEYIEASGPSSSVRDFNESKVIVNMPIFRGGALVYSVAESSASFRAGEQEYQNTRRNVTLEVKKNYYAIVKADNILINSLQINDKLQVLSKQISKQYEQGLRSRIDMLKVQVALKENQVKTQEMQNEIMQFKNELEVLAGVRLDISRGVMVPREELSLDSDVCVYIDLVQRKHPELHQIIEELNATKYGVLKSQAAHYPQVDFSASYGASGRELSGLDEEWRGVVKVSVPLWEWGRIKSTREQAQSKRRQKQIQLENSRKLIEQKVKNIYANIKLQKQYFQTCEFVVQVKKDEIKIAEHNYKMEAISSSELVTLYKEYMVEQSNYWDSWYRYYLSMAEFNGLITGEID